MIDRACTDAHRSLRVLHITFNMGIGGTEQVIRQLVEGLDASIVVSEVLCIDGQVGPIGESLRDQGIPVHSLARSPGFDRALIKAIRSRIRDGHFDLVHCHQYTPYVYGWLGALGTSARVVFTEHGRFHPDRYRYKAALFNALIARFSFGLVAISRATREALVRYEFMPRSKIRVIYNGIKPMRRYEQGVGKLRETLGIPENDFVVGTVARLDPVKNQPMMLRAFAEFHREYPASWLLLVGDGPDRKKLEQLADELGIRSRTLFPGFINEPANYLSLMDVFLLSSHTEGTSMTLLEAMSLGIPTVATQVGGTPEIVRNMETGILVPTDDTQRFCRAICQLRENDELRSRMENNAQQLFQERFSAAAMVNEYTRLYKGRPASAQKSIGGNH